MSLLPREKNWIGVFDLVQIQCHWKASSLLRANFHPMLMIFYFSEKWTLDKTLSSLDLEIESKKKNLLWQSEMLNIIQ